MPKPKALVLKTAGMNCDGETAFAFESAGAAPEFVHINQLVAGERTLSSYQILAVSGGFTYGDDIAAGKVLANELRCKLWDGLKKFVQQDKLIIGICNGFQVLVKAGLLPDPDAGAQEATLVSNDCGVFQDRWVYCHSLQESKCLWTKGLPRVITLPIAHGEGKFIPRSEAVLERLKQNNQIVFQYCDARGHVGDYPVNPNGSIDSIAGICDVSGRVFGLMPHPERHLIGLQHPRWTREGLKRHGDGFSIFLNAVNYFK
jgi:phosphoribosylformylglycinamidine synthase